MTPPTEHRDPLADGVSADRGELHNEDVAHEHSDINVRAVILFLAGLTAVGFLAAGAMWVVFNVLEGQAARNDPAPSPLAQPATAVPGRPDSPFVGNAPDPKLVTREPDVLEDQHAKERKTLESGGWVDRNAGIGRIPIEEAKKVLLHRGLPTRGGDPPDPRLGTRAPSMSDASSGRNATVQPRRAQEPGTPAAPPASTTPPVTGKPAAGQKPGGRH